MSDILIDLSTSELIIKKKIRFLNLIGFVFTVLPIVFFITFMIFHPERMGSTLSIKIFSIIVILFLIFYLSRVVFLLVVDKNLVIQKIDDKKIKILNKEYMSTNITSLLVIEYFGFRTMPNGFHIFLKMNNKKKIALVVRLNKEEKENVVDVLKKFLKIDKIEKKNWWIN